MRALSYDGERASVVDKPAPEQQPGYALVRPTLAGICNTDLEIVKGYMGFSGTLGHELVGRVESGPTAWRGKRVVSEINFACGGCDMCARDLGRHCAKRTVMGIVGQDGAFAELVAVPIDNLHAVPDALGDEAAVFVEPLAAAYEIVEQVRVVEGAEAVVLGDGKLGMLIAQVLAGAGLRVLSVGKHPDHLALLAERGVATTLLDDWDRTPRDLVVEASGSAAALPLAMEATRPRGTLVLKTTAAEREPIDMTPLVIDEITVVGSRCGPFAPAIAALTAGDVDVGAMVAATLPLDDGVAALEQARRRGCLKVLLAINR